MSRTPKRVAPIINVARVTKRSDVSRQVIIDEMSRVSKAATRAREVAAYLGTGEDVELIIGIAKRVAEAASAASPAEGEA